MARAQHDKDYVFAQMPVGQAVAYLVVPTILTQIISIVYNLADTFFIGQLADPTLVAAVGVGLPPMLILTALANLFGVGASSAISRALGTGKKERARLYSSFALWCGIGVTFVYIVFTTVFREAFVYAIGGTDETYAYICAYLDWTLMAGGLVFFLSSLLAHFLRTVGRSVTASVGVASGAVLNIVLDPVFIFVLDLGIVGVAAASLAGQVLALVILATSLVRSRGDGVIVPRPTAAAFRDGVGTEVIQIGFVSFCMTALAQVSNTAINILVSPYGTHYLAASSVAIKINIAVFSLAQGISVGVLPLIGYNYAAGNAERVKRALKILVSFDLIVGVVCMSVCLLLSGQIIAVFIDDALTIEVGRVYIRSVGLCMIPSPLVYAASSYMQAIGQKWRPYILAFTRMGTVDVVFMVICNAVLGAPGVLLGKPIADWLCLCTAIIVLNNLRKHVNPFSAKLPAGAHAGEEERGAEDDAREAVREEDGQAPTS